MQPDQFPRANQRAGSAGFSDGGCRHARQLRTRIVRVPEITVVSDKIAPSRAVAGSCMIVLFTLAFGWAAGPRAGAIHQSANSPPDFPAAANRWTPALRAASLHHVQPGQQSQNRKERRHRDRGGHEVVLHVIFAGEHVGGLGAAGPSARRRAPSQPPLRGRPGRHTGRAAREEPQSPCSSSRRSRRSARLLRRYDAQAKLQRGAMAGCS